VSFPALRALAPGQVNLALFLGPTRPDGLHELVSLVQPVSLADELELQPAPGSQADEVLCPPVTGPNLAADALAAYRRDSGWSEPAVRLTIAKRVPVAAGMGGGSSDAATALRLAAYANTGTAIPDHRLRALAPTIGADVSALLHATPTLVGGAGESVESVADREPFGLVLVPMAEGLSTPVVYAEADRLGSARSHAELAERRSALLEALSDGALPPSDLLVNDLQAAASSLCPAIGGMLDTVREAGARNVLVSGSGPTVFGIFPGIEGPAVAAAAGAELAERFPGAVAAAPVTAEFAEVRVVEEKEGG
jgi:4-diphosphocytidyl-2-C-methyl-D-erythritol kinase